MGFKLGLRLSQQATITAEDTDAVPPLPANQTDGDWLASWSKTITVDIDRQEAEQIRAVSELFTHCFKYPNTSTAKVQIKLEVLRDFTLYSDHLREHKSWGLFGKSSWAVRCSVRLHQARASRTWKALHIFILLSVPFLAGNGTVLAHGWLGGGEQRQKERRQCVSESPPGYCALLWMDH